MPITAMYHFQRSTYDCLTRLSTLPFSELRSIPAVFPARAAAANRSASIGRALWHAGTEGQLERLASLVPLWSARQRGHEKRTCFSMSEGTKYQLHSLQDRLAFLTKGQVPLVLVLHTAIWVAYLDEIAQHEDRAHMRVPEFDLWLEFAQKLEQHAQRPLAAKVWGR